MHYAQGSELRSLGLEIRPEVEEAARSFLGACVSCDELSAPPGLDSRRELAEWAVARARLAPVEPLTAAQRAKVFPGSRHTKCPLCNAQLLAVIGIPNNLLEPFMDAFNGYWRPRVKAFLETRFVLLLCHDCASSSTELEITPGEIAARYNKARKAFVAHNFDIAPSYANALTDRIFQQLDVQIVARDRALRG